MLSEEDKIELKLIESALQSGLVSGPDPLSGHTRVRAALVIGPSTGQLFGEKRPDNETL